MGHGDGDEFEGVVYFFFGGEFGEREADTGSGSGGGEAHGREDVGRFGCAGLAGAASADGEAFEVKGDNEGFGFDVVEIDVCGVRYARGSRAVDACFRDLGEDALLEAFAEGG